MGLILRKYSCYKLQPETCDPRLFGMIYSEAPRSPSFSAQGEQRGVCSGLADLSRSRFMDGLRSMLRWFRDRVLSLWIRDKFASCELQTWFCLWVITQHGFLRVAEVLSTSRYPCNVTIPPLHCQPPKHFYVKKFLSMIMKSSSTENRFIQSWMDPSSECLWAFVDSRYSNFQSLCHEPIVQLPVCQTKQQRRAAWIIRRLMPHEIYIECDVFPVIRTAL